MNPIKELLELAQQREDIERQLVKAVAKARADKHSWQAIANAIGGTKQAAQQRYGKVVEPLMEQGKYECNCGWTIVYPGWEADEAMEEIGDHQEQHYQEDERDDYGTEPADLEAAEEVRAANRAELARYAADATGQLPAETATVLDEVPPAAKPFRPGLSLWTETPNIDAAEQAATQYEYEWQDPAPRRTAAAAVDVEDDLTRVETGELDTAGNTIDWSGRGAPQCYYCDKTHHYQGKGSSRYFWFYPGCNPTYRDHQFTPTV